MLRILDAMPVDPSASHFYEQLSGGFLWSDEFPTGDPAKWEIVSHDYLYRWILHLRARITKGETELADFPLWQQLVENAPNWPGLHPERRSEEVRRRLFAAERLAERCYKRLEQEFENEKESR